MNLNTDTVVALRITTRPDGRAFYFANGLRISRDQYGSLADDPRQEKRHLTAVEAPDGTHRADFQMIHDRGHVYAVIGRQRWLTAPY
jgi:hypothetical protein